MDATILPVVSNEVALFVRVIFVVEVAPLLVTDCKLPVVELALILDKPPPSPMNTAGDCKTTSNDAVLPFSRAS